jgi:AcrR family transcriptional regulator
MRDIFSESGLSAGAVYNHFPSKHELIEHLARESEKKWLEIFAAYPRGRGRDSKKKLKMLVTSMIEDLSRPEVVADVASDIGIWAFSIHKDTLRASCRNVFLTIARGFDRILSGEEGPTPPGTAPPGSSAGAHLLAHLQGLGLQAAMGMPLDLQREKERASALIDRLVRERNA